MRLLFLVLFFALLSAVAIQPAASQRCTSVLPIAGHWPLKNLKSANFYINFPPDLRQALDCRDHEKECALREVGPNASDAGQVVIWVNRLKNLNRNYPLALYPDSLEKVLRPLYKKAISFALPHDSSRQAPDPTMLSPYSNNYPCTAATPSTFNLILTVTLVTTTNPHIVVLTRTLYRHGNEDYFPPDIPFSTAIPLNLPNQEIEKEVERFMNIAMNYFYAESAAHAAQE